MDWLKKGDESMTQTRAADLLRISENYLCSILKGVRTPSYQKAAEMSILTLGKITVEEVLWPDGSPKGTVMAKKGGRR